MVIAGVIAGVIFSDKGNQNVSPTSLYTGFKTIVTNQAKTKVPTQTSAPLPAIPVTSGYPDPTMYDDFGDTDIDMDYIKCRSRRNKGIIVSKMDYLSMQSISVIGRH